MRPENEKTSEAVPAFDYADWHAAPDCDVDVIGGPAGQLFVFCRKHDTIASLEAVSTRIKIAASSH